MVSLLAVVALVTGALYYNSQLRFALNRADANAESAGKHAEAIAICDKVLADPQLHPQIKQVATNIKNAATAAAGKK